MIKKAQLPTIRTVKKSGLNQTKEYNQYIESDRSLDDQKIMTILRSSQSPLRKMKGKGSLTEQKYAHASSCSSEFDSESSWISVTKHEHDCQCIVCYELEPLFLYRKYQDVLDFQRREHDPPEQLYQRSLEIL